MIRKRHLQSLPARELALDWKWAFLPAAMTLLSAAMAVLFPLPVRADDSFRCVSLVWDAVTENEDETPCTDLAKYRVHVGESSGSYNQTFDTTEVSYAACDLEVGHTYYFAVTAIDTSDNESDYSNEVSATINPSELAQSRPSVLDLDGSGKSSIVTLKRVRTGARKQLRFRVYALNGSHVRDELLGSWSDLPALADYDGDDIVDLAVVHRAGSSYRWISRNSSDSQLTSVTFGRAEDKPLAGCQFDTDVKADRALIKEPNKLAVKKSLNGKVRVARIKRFPLSVKAISCADMDGDGVDELMVLGKGGPAVRSASTRTRAIDRRWRILGFDAVSGKQVYSRLATKPLGLVVADFDDSSVLDAAFTRKLQNSSISVNFFVGDASNATAVSLEALTAVTGIKLSESSQGIADSLIYSTKAGRSIKTYNLLAQSPGDTGITLEVGERLVGSVSARR